MKESKAIHVCKGCGRKKEVPLSQVKRTEYCRKCYRQTSKFKRYNSINNKPRGTDEK